MPTSHIHISRVFAAMMFLDARTFSSFFILPLLSVRAAHDDDYFASATNCNDGKLAICMDGLSKVGFAEDLVSLTSEEELVKSCSDIQKAMKCVNGFTNRCFNSQQTKFYELVTSGAKKLTLDLCTRGTPFRRKYLVISVCYRDLPEDYRKCAADYLKGKDFLKKLLYFDGEEVRSSCCLLSAYQKCVHSVVLSACNAEAAKMADHMTKMIGGSIFEVKCARYQHGSKHCISGSVLCCIHPIMLISTLMTILAKQRLIDI